MSTGDRTLWWQRGLPPVGEKAESSMDKALAAAGLDFNVEMRPVAHSWDKDKWCKSEKVCAVVRDDTETILGMVTGRYHPIQHRDALSFVTEICENFDAAIDRVWSRRGRWGADGSRIIVATSYKRDVDIAGIETVRPWLLFTAGHDGMAGITMQVIPVQMHCLNQLPMLKGRGGVHRVVHSPRANDRFRTVTELILAADRSMDALGLELERLVSQPMSAKESSRVVEQAIAGANGSPKAKEDDALQIVRLMENPMTLPKGAEGTRFAVLHAVTEHYSHIREYRTREAHEREMTNGRAGAICRRTMELLSV